MFGLPGFTDTQLVVFFGSLVRVSSMFVAMPFFSHRSIPPMVKILLSFGLTIAFFPMVLELNKDNSFGYVLAGWGNLFLFIGKEVLLGLIVGFIAKIIFESILFAFEYMGLQMGFGFASTFDPSTNSNSSVISQLIFILAFLLFLAVDGHQILIRSIMDTFTAVPLGLVVIQKFLVSYAVEVVREVFVIAVKLAAPVAVVAFITNVAFGVIARAVPQVNVLVISFTVNILIGLIVIGLLLPVLFEGAISVFGLLDVRIEELVRILGG